MPHISIVIPAKNEEGYIDDCLKSIESQTFKDYEIIIVDGGDDRTMEIARKYGAKVIIEKRKGPATARNIGAKHAKGEILIFADADVRFEQNFLMKIERKFNRDIGGAICKSCAYDAKTGKYNILYDLTNIFAWFLIKCGLIVTTGSCFIYRKNMFEKAGGFDEKLCTAEDHDLAKRISKIARFEMFNDLTINTSARRANRMGFNKAVLLTVKSSLFYFFKHKGLYEYWNY